MDSKHQPDEGQQLALYRQMLTIRRFEERCNYLYMQGRIPSTLHLYIGQEAVAVGVCANLTAEDYVASTHRPHGHAIAKGVSMRASWPSCLPSGRAAARARAAPCTWAMCRWACFGHRHRRRRHPGRDGAALACKRLGGGRVSVAFFGEGATNEGAFHEALNMAALWQLPAIFVCENNLYAASTPIASAFRVPEVANRAATYGMPGEVADGNDVLAVYEAAGRAIARARAGGGPTLLECKTYRQCGHSRSDPRTYRSKEEEQEWAACDPILRLAGQLKAAGLASDESLAAIEGEVAAAIDDAVAFAESSPAPAAEETLEDVFYGEGPIPFRGAGVPAGGAR